MRKRLSTLVLACLAGHSLFAQAVVDPDLKKALQTSPLAQVVVTFQGEGAPQPAQLNLLRQLGISKGLTFRAVPIAGVLATAAQVDALAHNPQVKSLYYNKRLSYYNHDDTHLTGVKRLRADKELTARNKGIPVSGKGIGVLINDSGVDGTHEDIKLGTHLVQNTLGSTNLNSYDAMLPVTYLEGVPNTDTNSGHGTHCAGTVGGNGARSSGKYEGVAPGASLLGYGSGGALLVLDAIGGFDYALTHQYQYNIRVISNSFGTSGDFEPTDPINVITKKAYDRGMVVVFAAGNEGPGADTHNPYAIAPWTISVGAGDRFGRLADFSSRGVKGEGGTFVMDGETWSFANKPVIVAPGVDVVSTRVIAPVSSLGAQMDAELLEPAHIPFYTHMSGTSMATPHLAGVVALMLEANPSLSPAQVRQILEKTATNMPGRESWEVGAGYVNAYAAVDKAFRSTNFGSTVNATRSFNSNVNFLSARQDFSINYSPLPTSTNQLTFAVAPGTNSLEVKVSATGLLGQTGNPVNLILTDPNGVEHRSGIPVLFAQTYDRSVAVAAPAAGTWTLKAEGLQGLALPETITGNITQTVANGTTGLGDISGHPAEAAIKLAVSKRLADGLNGGYRPDDLLRRIQLADYLLMGQAVRQYLPTTGAVSFTDVTGDQLLLAEAVTAKGAALRDRFQQYNGLMRAMPTGQFSANGTVDRTTLAYALVQALGLQEAALARTGKPVTVQADGKTIPVEDAAKIPAGLEGYVSVALELNLINAYYTLTQGTFDLQPTLHATFKPTQNVTRADFAVIVTRTFPQWEALTQPVAGASQTSPAGTSAAAARTQDVVGAYPNPFSSTTTLSYNLPQEGFVTVDVYNLLGRKVKSVVAEQMMAGYHEVKLDASNLTRGTYLFTVKANGTTSSHRLVVQ
ncbi:S8/S53 family peptidase [Hymenobacter metallicola]|uniref:T9SS type A sorting domain-containing protein n=1 Tax=Hymenobacter metallicola TaxID=2563114 RepID=A0A4Z0Q1G3_9BACT|nr:S8/S53 family peptidase [Hymenobacter metallicola]TGE23329.1 T9SS type A sorting domain-containing protein [Hymenobacter metallicola]